VVSECVVAQEARAVAVAEARAAGSTLDPVATANPRQVIGVPDGRLEGFLTKEPVAYGSSEQPEIVGPHPPQLVVVDLDPPIAP
jgi:hypothetical protein